MPRFFSFLSLRSDSREQALRDFVAGGIIEKCRDVVPGFVGAAMLGSLHDPAAAAILVEWEDEQAYLDWQRSPAREGLKGAERFEPPEPSELFAVVHEVHRKIYEPHSKSSTLTGDARIACAGAKPRTRAL